MPAILITETSTPRRLSIRLLISIATIILLAFTAITSVAQTGQGSITGRVTDPKGNFLVGAVVIVTNDATQEQNKTKTNDSGVYNVGSLDPGTYSVSVSSKGFTQESLQGLIVSAADTVQGDASLKVGSETMTITVTAQDSLLSTTSDVSTTVDQQIVENLPYPERSALEAVLLVPGVSGDPTQPGGIASENAGITTGAVTPGATITVGGTPPGGTAFYIDGSDVRQGSYPRSGINLSGQVVGSVTVVVSGASAKYGRTGSGVIIQTSRAGTDQYHGQLSWRHTDPYFNAYPDGETLPNNNHQNFFGAYLGGPVRIPKIYDGRRKTFFEVGIEPARSSNAQGARGLFQTADELAGHLNNSIGVLDQADLRANGYAHAINCARATDPNFEKEVQNGVAVGQCLPPSATYQSSLYYQAPTGNADVANSPWCATAPAGIPCGGQYAGGQTTLLMHPITGPLADCGGAYASANPTATACPNDVGPQLAVNPFAQFVVSQYPTPGNPGPFIQFDNSQGTLATDGTNANYERGVKNFDNRYSFRIDQQFNNSNRMFVRYTEIPITNVRYYTAPATFLLTSVPRYNINSHDIAIGFTHIFTNNLVDDFYYSFLRVNQQSLPPVATLSQDYAAKYGLTPAILGKGFPNLGAFTDGTNPGYVIQPGNLSGGDQAQIDENFIVGDNFTWTHGTHLIQFGIDIRWIQSNQYDSTGLYGGKYTFSQNSTSDAATGGSALGSFILGQIGGFSDTPQSVPGYYRWRYYAGYIQDDWRVFPRLTINMGLRYNIETPRIEKFNNQAFVVPQAGVLNGVSTNAAFCFSGSCGLHGTMWPTNYDGFEPRLGIAWAPTPRTTVRASYALSHLPLSGYDPSSATDPDFNVTSSSVGGTAGGTHPGYVNYLSNPVPNGLQSTFTALQGGHGPFYSSTGLAPAFVEQTKSVPYIQNWSLTIQFQPAQKTVVQATYQGLHGVHLIGPFTNPINSASISQAIAASQSGQYLSSVVGSNPYGITNPGSTTPIVENALQALYPYQNFFNQALDEIYPRNGTLHYDAFYISVNQRATKNLSFLTNYSWSKSLDNIPDTTTSNGGGFGVASQQNPFDLNAEYSLSSFDQPSKFRAGYSYNLPFGVNQRFNTHRHWLDQIIGNFSTAGILSSMSGFPNHVSLGGSGYFQSLTPQGTGGCAASATVHYCSSTALPLGYLLRPNFVPGVPLINKNWRHNPFNSLGPGGITPYLNPSAFTVPGSPGFPALGNVPRTLGNARSPRELFFDVHVQKGVTFKRRYQLNITIDAVNALNHPVYFGATSSSLYTGTTINTQATNLAGAYVQNPTVNFGEMNSGGTGSMSRTVRFGAQLTF